MNDESVTLILDMAKADVRAIWERFGFMPTTDEERALRQLAHPHAEQCRCKFCQQKEASA